MCNKDNSGGFYALPTTVGYEGHDLRFNRKPMYSLGIRTSAKKSSGYHAMPLGVESSNVTRFGKQEAPMFSIAGRSSGDNPGDHSPGPVYKIKDSITRHSPPQFSISGRNRELTSDRPPGPKYAFSANAGKSSPVAFSLGNRCFISRTNKMPSPAEYPAPNLDACRPSAPKVSMKFKRREFFDDSYKTPGPNTYYPQSKPSGGFSFGVRHHPCAGLMLHDQDE